MPGIVGLEKSWRVRQVDFDPEDFAEPHRVRTDHGVRLSDGVLGVDERRAAFERDADERPNLPFARGRMRGAERTASDRRPYHRRLRSQRTKISRNRRANGETVTSPASSENGRASPELFASRINVSPRNGAVRIMDEEPLSEMPNCQTIGSPL